MIKITAKDGQMIRDTFTGAVYSEVVCDDKQRERFVLADSENDPITVTELEGMTLKERVADLENAVTEIAKEKAVDINLKVKAVVDQKAENR